MFEIWQITFCSFGVAKICDFNKSSEVHVIIKLHFCFKLFVTHLYFIGNRVDNNQYSHNQELEMKFTTYAKQGLPSYRPGSITRAHLDKTFLGSAFLLCTSLVVAADLHQLIMNQKTIAMTLFIDLIGVFSVTVKNRMLSSFLFSHFFWCSCILLCLRQPCALMQKRNTCTCH